MSKQIPIAYHSGYGHTAGQALAVFTGVNSVVGAEGIFINVAEVEDTNWHDLAAPTYMGSVSAKFKEFTGASSKAWFANGWKDKLGSLIQLSFFAAGHYWIENQIRPIAIGRNNWLFAGSLGAGQRAAAVMSLIQSAHLTLAFFPYQRGIENIKVCCPRAYGPLHFGMRSQRHTAVESEVISNSATSL